MDENHEDILKKLAENKEADGAAAAAVHSEVSTTKAPDQKVELANELFPPVKTKRQMRTRRVIH